MKTTHFEPGGGSRYTMSEVPCGNGTVFILWNNNSGKAMKVISAFTHWVYVAEKLRLNEEDAKAVAFFINSRVREPWDGYEPEPQDLPRGMDGDPKGARFIPAVEGESL